MLPVIDDFWRLLAKFQVLKQPTFYLSAAKHGVEHRISTTGPLVYSLRIWNSWGWFTALTTLGLHPLNHPQTWQWVVSTWHVDLMKQQHLTSMLFCMCRIFHSTWRVRWFFKVDLIWGYHQVPIHPLDIPKTAVVTPYGLFELLCMPFGLKHLNASWTQVLWSEGISHKDII